MSDCWSDVMCCCCGGWPQVALVAASVAGTGGDAPGASSSTAERVARRAQFEKFKRD